MAGYLTYLLLAVYPLNRKIGLTKVKKRYARGGIATTLPG